MQIPLHVHLRFFAFGRGRQRHNPKRSRAQSLSERLNYSPLAGAVASFEDNTNLLLLTTNPFLQLHEFDVQPRKLLLVFLSFQLFGGGVGSRIDCGVGLRLLVRFSHKSTTFSVGQA